MKRAFQIVYLGLKCSNLSLCGSPNTTKLIIWRWTNLKIITNNWG